MGACNAREAIVRQRTPKNVWVLSLSNILRDRSPGQDPQDLQDGWCQVRRTPAGQSSRIERKLKSSFSDPHRPPAKFAKVLANFLFLLFLLFLRPLWKAFQTGVGFLTLTLENLCWQDQVRRIEERFSSDQLDLEQFYSFRFARFEKKQLLSLIHCDSGGSLPWMETHSTCRAKFSLCATSNLLLQ